MTYDGGHFPHRYPPHALWDSDFYGDEKNFPGKFSDNVDWNGYTLDPKDVIFTSVYQSEVISFYSHAQSLVFSPSDDTEGGGGLDVKWSKSRCLRPGQHVDGFCAGKEKLWVEGDVVPSRFL